MHASKVHIGMRGHFRNAGVPCKEWVHEFEVSEDAHLPAGKSIPTLGHTKQDLTLTYP
jgi:hypothetical protein